MRLSDLGLNAGLMTVSPKRRNLGSRISKMSFQSLYIANNEEDSEEIQELESEPKNALDETADADDELETQEENQQPKVDYVADSITLYLAKLNKVPLLKREEEIHYAQQIERGTQKSRRILSRS